MILKRGKSYGVRVYRGAYRTEWIGSYETRREARLAEADAMRRARRSRMSCDQFATFFLEGYAERVKGSTLSTAQSALRAFSRDWRGIPLSAVTPLQAERWARENRWAVPVVVTLFNDAKRKRLVEDNPFSGIVRKGEGRKRIVPLSAEDVERLAVCAGKVHAPLRGLVLFAAYTGIRPGELFALEWDDIDFEALRVHVRRRVYAGRLDLPKSGRERTVVLPPPARDALLTVPRRPGRVFYSKRERPLSQSNLAGYWQQVKLSYGRPIDFYDLRHRAAHYFYVELGLPDYVVAEQLGHSDGGKLVRELYGHGEHGALERIDAALGQNVRQLREAR